ncbi:MAG: GTP cyclohydrolase II [Chloracidobacterium sp.]|nr:GTP cyclohydrolase II [Chloracidobacterium sp.]MCC6826057.1 GTP cyclohydrolase II [Acidobacteriota bacterium]MCO5333740.1 GTP cyclohydrolase II [Pyrinomonadaceae bacterium]
MRKRTNKTNLRPVRSGVKAKTVEKVAEAKLPTEYGHFRLMGFRSLTSDEEFVVLAMGTHFRGRPTLVRMHSQCMTGDVFGSAKCDCGQQLHAAMLKIAKEKHGIIVYHQQEGRGIGIMNKIRAYALQDAGADTIEANHMLGLPTDLRHYEQCAEILAQLGVDRVRLMSNNPEKFKALRDYGLEVTERVPLPIEFYKTFAGYLRTKRDRMGHYIELPERTYERPERCAA